MTMRNAVAAMVLAGTVVLAAMPSRAAPGKDDAGFVDIDIYAIPSRPVVDAVAGVSERLDREGMTSFYARGHAVHVTLYLTRYPASAEPRLKAAVAALARRARAFPLSVEGLERTPSNWLFVRVKRSDELQRLADTVTLGAEPWRDRAAAPPAWMAAYPAKLPAFERYGSPNVFMQFDPHLTLLANETSSRLDAFMAAGGRDAPAVTGRVEGLGIGIVDANGQVVRTLAEYRFLH